MADHSASYALYLALPIFQAACFKNSPCRSVSELSRFIRWCGAGSGPVVKAGRYLRRYRMVLEFWHEAPVLVQTECKEDDPADRR